MVKKLMVMVFCSMLGVACAGTSETPAIALARPDTAGASCSTPAANGFAGCEAKCFGRRPICTPGRLCPALAKADESESEEEMFAKTPIHPCEPAAPRCACE